jgi:hypothetical protein
MVSSSNILNLTLPRYEPIIVRGTSLSVWHDTAEAKYVVLCPRCHNLISYDTLASLYHEMVSCERRCCQGCRAKISFEHDPGLIGLFLDFWYRTGSFPQSSSWMEAIPQTPLNIWAKQIPTTARSRAGEA